MEILAPFTTLIVLLIFGVPLFMKLVVIVDQYERAIVLTLGKYSYTLSPGLQLVVPFVQL
jgi:regulator of protease activity HflC (stomatin/prohibitin superfamily)